MMKLLHFSILLLSLFSLACSNDKQLKKTLISKHKPAGNKNLAFKSDSKTIHVFVALCDNKYQGIVPVPEKLETDKTQTITFIGVVHLECAPILRIVKNGNF